MQSRSIFMDVLPVCPETGPLISRSKFKRADSESRYEKYLASRGHPRIAGSSSHLCRSAVESGLGVSRGRHRGH